MFKLLPLFEGVKGMLYVDMYINIINLFFSKFCRYDQRVRDLLDFSIYLDISNEVKFAWKIQVTD